MIASATEQARPWPLRLGVAAPVALAAAYFLGSLLGLSLQFPGTRISAIWPPNAILLAALLVTPRARWWICLSAVLPAHLLAQLLTGIPGSVVLINFAGNVGDALLGALAIDHFLGEPRRFNRLRAVVLIMLFGGIVAPAIMSFVVAGLFAWLGSSADPWLEWRLRLLTNALAVFTLVPPIVLTFTKAWSPAKALEQWRSREAGALLTGLVVTGILVFGLERAGPGTSPLLLYLPLPFLVWAAMRFGPAGVSLSVLVLGALAMWGTIHGYGPFAEQYPVENATSLVLFLAFTCAPLLMLAALLEEHESLDHERRQAAALHGAVLASMHDEIAVVDRDGRVREVNESWRAAGRPEPGTQYLDAWKGSSAEAAALIPKGVEAVLSGARKRFQAEIMRTHSPAVWVEVSVEGLKHPDGGAVITNTDVTSRKQAEMEMRQQRRELAHLTRVTLLGELSGTLAHELNQPLTAILSNAQAAQRMLAREPVDLAEVREILRDIADDDRRAGAVIQRMRAMLKKEEPRVALLDLNETVQEALSLEHSDLITRNVSVALRLAPDLPPVRGDRVQLQQVLLNLILNACEAMSRNPANDRKLKVDTARDQEHSVRVAVTDCGAGIPADATERVFEPFFTTKEHGLGLGLSISRSIVTAHGGRLWASNNEDRGATFYLTLPVEDEPPA